LHVFTYSERENTDAASMQNVVPLQERKRRNKMLRILSEKKKNQFYSNYLDTDQIVLMEEENKDGVLSGFTANYIRVSVPYDPAFVNQLVKVKLISFDGGVSVNSKFIETIKEHSLETIH